MAAGETFENHAYGTSATVTRRQSRLRDVSQGYETSAKDILWPQLRDVGPGYPIAGVFTQVLGGGISFQRAKRLIGRTNTSKSEEVSFSAYRF